jgi:aminoglycoside 3-N-acetyltransferase
MSLDGRTSIEAARFKLHKQLRDLGLAQSDTVMVHASLRAVGPIEGRAATLVEALLDVLGAEGTLVAYVDYEKTSEVPYFDRTRSPASISHGVFAETVRSWPEAVRSENPGASTSAIGARAAWLCAEHPMDYGYGAGSPFAKLVDVGGKVLLLGSDLDNVSLLHHAEDRAALPRKRVIRVVEPVLFEGQLRDVTFEEFDTSYPIMSEMPEHYFEDIVSELIAKGGARSGKVGDALSYLFSARELVQFAIEKMEREFGR